MDLHQYLNKKIRIEDTSGNIIECTPTWWEDGYDEAEDLPIYGKENLTFDERTFKVIKNVDYDGYTIIHEIYIKSIEVIK